MPTERSRPSERENGFRASARQKNRKLMLTNLAKIIICSLGTLCIAASAVACDQAGGERPTYVVYQVQTEQPESRYSTSRTYYSCAVEYRQVTEYSRTTRSEERS